MTSIDNLVDEIMETCLDHVDMIGRDAEKRVKAAGKACAKELREVSPKRTGEYAAGWRSDVTEPSRGVFKATVHNVKKWQLIQLLEFGHGLVWMGHPTGRRVGPKPHLDRGYDAGARELLG